MCSATVGATPVKRCTVAASDTFSYGSRGTPSWGNTLNRVPEFAYAQDAVSMRWVRRTPSTRALVSGERSVTVVSQLGVEVEHFVEHGEAQVGPAAGQLDEELCHLGLPPPVDVGRLHGRLGGREVVGQQVAHEQAVIAEEQRIVVPSGV